MLSERHSVNGEILCKKVNQIWVQPFKHSIFQFMSPLRLQCSANNQLHLQIYCSAGPDVKKCSTIQSKKTCNCSDNITVKKKLGPVFLKSQFGYLGLLKLKIILDLVTICITHARQIKGGKLINWHNFNISTLPCRELVDLIDILDIKRYRSMKRVQKKQKVFTLAIAIQLEKPKGDDNSS